MNELITTLPAGFRPSHLTCFPIDQYNPESGELIIYPNGEIRRNYRAYNEKTTIRSNGMNETIELEISNKQQLTDQVAVTVLGGLAGLVAHKLVEKGYKFAITAYRLKKAAV